VEIQGSGYLPRPVAEAQSLSQSYSRSSFNVTHDHNSRSLRSSGNYSSWRPLPHSLHHSLPANMVSASTDARKSPLVSLIAGGLAGGVECTVTYPFEYAKTRVQLKDNGVISRNPFAVIRDVVRKEGPAALYKGCTTLILGTIGKDAIRFISFDAIKDQFKDPETGTLSALGNLGAGIGSGVVSSTFVVTPTERIKTALIDDARQDRRFKGPWHCTRELVREYGIGAVYRGYVTTTMKQASTTAVRLGVYNILKDWEKVRGIEQTTVTTFANGAVAGTLVVALTQPFDTLKTRAQGVRGQGVVEAFKSVVADYGIRGLWRGSTMRLGRTVLAGGILFTSYEAIAELITPLMGKGALAS
jgi:solute carrier family 25 (mitochondrial citrate transporter), member 1